MIIFRIQENQQIALYKLLIKTGFFPDKRKARTFIRKGTISINKIIDTNEHTLVGDKDVIEFKIPKR
jgi:predicted rRNA methylase YqxC with S4 and FtsJ domains